MISLRRARVLTSSVGDDKHEDLRYHEAHTLCNDQHKESEEPRIDIHARIREACEEARHRARGCDMRLSVDNLQAVNLLSLTISLSPFLLSDVSRGFGFNGQPDLP